MCHRRMPVEDEEVQEDGKEVPEGVWTLRRRRRHCPLAVLVLGVCRWGHRGDGDSRRVHKGWHLQASGGRGMPKRYVVLRPAVLAAAAAAAAAASPGLGGRGDGPRDPV